jgi:pimeloyl-ACP methyl ester carboxylesterase
VDRPNELAAGDRASCQDEGTRHGLKQKNREELIADQRAEQPDWADAELQPWADAKLRFSPNVLSVYDRDNGSNVDWRAVLGRITCPALLVISDSERGGIVSLESAAALKALVPHLEIVHVRRPAITSAATSSPAIWTSCKAF